MMMLALRLFLIKIDARVTVVNEDLRPALVDRSSSFDARKPTDAVDEFTDSYTCSGE